MAAVAVADASYPRPSKDAERVRAYSARAISEHVTRGGPAASLARQVRILDTLQRASSQLVLHRPLPELFELLLDLLFAAVPAERGAILLLDDGRLATRASRSRLDEPMPQVSRSIARRVLDERVAVLLDNALEDPDFGTARSVIEAQVRSAIAAPLWTMVGEQEQVVGLVYLDTARFAHAFDEEDLGLVTAIANVAAVKLLNARLLEESFEKRQLEEDMRLAGQLQARLLPSAPPALEGWSLSASARPCRAVGGDYYDWDVRPDGVRLAFGDVAGKGTSAALVMTMLRALTRTCWDGADLGAAAERLNHAMLENVPLGRYATAFIARLDPHSGALRYVNAGHPAPLLLRAGGSVERLEHGGVPLGLFGGARYASGDAELQAGDRLLVFSDGISEARNALGEEFGVERLAELAERARTLDANALARLVGVEIDAFSHGGRAGDDRTVLALKRDRRPMPPGDVR